MSQLGTILSRFEEDICQLNDLPSLSEEFKRCSSVIPLLVPLRRRYLNVPMGEETQADNAMQSHSARGKSRRQYVNQHTVDRRNTVPCYTTVVFYVIQISIKCLGYIILRYCSNFCCSMWVQKVKSMVSDEEIYFWFL
jgi:hypothetical protein